MARDFAVWLKDTVVQVRICVKLAHGFGLKIKIEFKNAKETYQNYDETVELVLEDYYQLLKNRVDF